MKKVKLMLLSLALLAVVGGALAFKARFIVEYCTTNAVLNPQQVLVCPVNSTCPNLRIDERFDPNGAIFCTTTPSTKLADPDDPNSTITICTDPGRPGNPALTCFATTKLVDN